MTWMSGTKRSLWKISKEFFSFYLQIHIACVILISISMEDFSKNFNWNPLEKRYLKWRI